VQLLAHGYLCLSLIYLVGGKVHIFFNLGDIHSSKQ